MSEEAREETPAAAESPFCGSLRSKKFFMRDGLATEAEHYLDLEGKQKRLADLETE